MARLLNFLNQLEKFSKRMCLRKSSAYAVIPPQLMKYFIMLCCSLEDNFRMNFADPQKVEVGESPTTTMPF